MLEPSVKELMNVIPERFYLVNIAAQRARVIADEADERGVQLREKPISLAIQDIASGRLTAYQMSDFGNG
ncbi:MAG: DNA-directed RNA polymerase subunit omega [Oscillospiraceae bacterium]|nr:DNA-directed RNA polymerase subunit omega [Oscillospiraceae bacterium]